MARKPALAGRASFTRASTLVRLIRFSLTCLATWVWMAGLLASGATVLT